MLSCNTYVNITVISLLTAHRRPIIAQNANRWGKFRVQPAVDGFNDTEVRRVLRDENIKFTKLCGHFNRYGALACWLSHYRAIQWQVHNKVSWMAYFEDDIIMQESWYKMIDTPLCGDYKETRCKRAHHLIDCDAERADIIQLGYFGEAYLLSFKGAVRVRSLMQQYGVIGCFDQQVTMGILMADMMHMQVINFRSIRPRPWKWFNKPNYGDIQNTKRIRTTHVQ